MMDNHVYNLMKQLVQESKSLWRIRNHYKDDAGDCADCKAFWEKAEAEKNGRAKELAELIKKHLA